MAATGTRIALIGSGFIADVHLQVLRTLPDLRVVALCDTVRARAERLARRHGVEHVFGSVDELLASGVADAVHVLVPPALHRQVALPCLQRGLHTLVEKPMALTAADLDLLERAAQQSGAVLGVNHNLTAHPAFERLGADVAAGRLGRLEHLVFVHNVPLRQLLTGDVGHFMFATEGNILFEQGVHLFAMVHRLLGSCLHVDACTGPARQLPNGVRFFDAWDVTLRCERGTAHVRMAFGRTMPETTVQAIGSDGAVFVDLQRSAVWRRGKTRWLEFLDHGIQLGRGGLHLLRGAVGAIGGHLLGLFGLRFPADPFLRSMRGSLRAFHRAVRARTQPDNGLPAARAVLQMCVDTAAAAGASLVAPVAAPWPEPGAARRGEVVVLGGAGFVGRHCVRQLLADGRPVTLVVRRPQLLPAEWRDAGLRVVVGDAADAAVLQRAFAGADSVLHLATVAGDDPAGVERAMATAVQTAGRVARDCGVRRLVYASSTAALWLGGRATVTGATPPDAVPGQRGAYARGKIAAEAALLELRAAGLDVVIVRPAIVLGHGQPCEHSGIGLWVKDNHCVGWGRGRVPLPLVLVDDCARGLVAALFAEAAHNRSYNLAGGVRPTAQEFVRELCARTGRDYRFHPTPVLWMWLQEVGKHLVKVLARRPREFPRLRDLRSRSFRAPLECSDAGRDLGFAPEADAAAFWRRLFEPAAVGATAPRRGPGTPERVRQ